MPTVDDLDHRETFLRAVAASAGALAFDAFRTRKPGDFTLKGHQDFLTEADGAVESHVRAEITEAFPDDGILGEEGGGKLSERLWVIDPIDGTANFARGIPHFCVSIAYRERGETLLGAIFNPASGELYFARKGHGATKNGAPIAVAATAAIGTASVEIGWSTRVEAGEYLAAQERVLGRGANIRRGASGALAIAWVAEGRTDGYAEYYMNAWDCLAGLLMVREAGGVTGTYPASESELLTGGVIFAAAPGIAAEFSAAMRIAIAPDIEKGEAA
ncbi:inositol monophosphatase family protein [Neorhizobium sp. NPDC001467]|uniref:inositol monophosphatase family protein n=1 Tax=Neorhizobium sp. NPDC001467 TaxID=3390595 RepID=UPI003CFC272D